MDYYEEVILIGRAGQDCRAGFTYISDPDSRTIKFGNRSKGTIIKHIWDFGDGSLPSFDQNPEHTYPASGYYLVCLTVVNNFGLPNTFCDFVQLFSPDEDRCFAEFFYNVDSASKTVEFVQVSHGDPDEFLWDFGDGGTSNEPNPTHPYSEADYYLVGLRVTNSSTNCSSTFFDLVNVGMGNQGLRASYTYTLDSSNLKADTYPIDFVGISLGDAGKLKWDFGDDTPFDTTTLNPTHIYTAPGTYTACLTVSNPNTGDEDTYCQQVTVGPAGIDLHHTLNSILGVFPNPFEYSTNIVYDLTSGTFVDLVLFDQTGRMVDILVRDDQIAGHYHLEYDGSKLDRGVYTLRLVTEQGIYTTRMIIR
jgi:PKD repeat protein